MFRIRALIVGFILIFGATSILAQDTSTQQSQPDAQSDEQKQKEKEAAERKAFALLDQVVDQASMLKLPENRIRIQIAAADMLWKHSEGRARSLFAQAGEGVADMMRSNDGNVRRWAAQLRQELILAVAQHDAPLAYQLLASTRAQTTTTDTGSNNFRRPNADVNLDQVLLARVAAIDPKVAMQKAEEALAKGQYPNTLNQVLGQLQLQDKDAARKLSEKVVSKLQSENLLTNTDAGTLALNLLRPGPRPPDTSSNNAQSTTSQTTAPQTSTGQAAANQAGANSSTPVLSQTSFQALMNAVIEAAMRATPQPVNNQRGGNNFRGRGNFGAPQNSDQSQPTDGQIEQINARRLLMGLQPLLSQIAQIDSSQATNLRNKIAEIGIGNNPRAAFQQMNTLMQQGTTDSLMAAAQTAPPPLQSRLYQQAAQKALDGGNIDQARQIANDHLDPSTRDAVLQKVDFQVMAQKMEADNMDQLQATLAGLRSDDERIDLLLLLASMAQKNNNDTKLAVKFLGEAQRLTNRRATNYDQLERQLRVAQAFAPLNPSKSFQVLEPGISQLNDLLSAAALLSGFEVDIFKDGELPIQGGSELGGMVDQYGEELAALAKIDFDRAQTTANRFQLAEPRLLVQLSIVRSVLGVPQAEPAANNGFNGFGGRGFGRRGQ
jgi:hypothetical protein